MRILNIFVGISALVTILCLGFLCRAIYVQYNEILVVENGKEKVVVSTDTFVSKTKEIMAIVPKDEKEVVDTSTIAKLQENVVTVVPNSITQMRTLCDEKRVQDIVSKVVKRKLRHISPPNEICKMWEVVVNLNVSNSGYIHMKEVEIIPQNKGIIVTKWEDYIWDNLNNISIESSNLTDTDVDYLAEFRITFE